MNGWRRPYVGEGADGARRSAEIDRDELDTLDRDDPRWDAIVDSIERWERQAEEEEKGKRASWSVQQTIGFVGGLLLFFISLMFLVSH